MSRTDQAGARGGIIPAGAWFVPVALMLAVGVAVAVRAQASPDGTAPPGDAMAAAITVVDSILPPEEEMRRFREGLDEPAALSGGAASLDDLVARFVDAVERADTLALAPLVLDRAEFAWLYYPHTIYTREPYRLSPALLWFQMGNLSDRTLTRLFRRVAGEPLHVVGHACEASPKEEGPNRIWNECRLTLHPPRVDEPFETRLFGSIIERGGVFKFVSYASEL